MSTENLPTSVSPSASTASRTIEYVRPWLYPAQEAAIFCPERYGLIEASTKSGKTVGCIAWLYEQAYSSSAGRNFWWIGPIYSQSDIAFRRLKRTLPPDIHHYNESKLTITLPNGAVIWFKGADKPDSLYGEDVYGAVCDEASRWKEDSWFAVRSTLTQTRGPIRLIGNVKGRKNFFFKLARRAQAGEPNMHYAKITAYDAVEAGILDPEEIEDARRTLPDHVFRELYLAEPSDDGGNPFGIDAIAAQIAPLVDTPPIAIGIDLAKSVDYSVLIGLDAAGDVCRFERWQGPWEDTIRRIVALTGTTPALCDSTGVGDPVLEALQVAAPGVFEGLKFTSSSKQQLMEGLAVAIQQRQIRYPEGPITSELESFEYEYTRTGCRYSAPDGMHDDCVMALGLAVMHWTIQRRDDLPFGWLRRDPVFREQVLGTPESDDVRLARRVAEYNAAQGT